MNETENVSKNSNSFDEMEQALLECVKNGFKPFSTAQRKIIISKQKKTIHADRKSIATSVYYLSFEQKLLDIFYKHSMNCYSFPLGENKKGSEYV